MWAVAAQPRVGLTPMIPTPSVDSPDVTSNLLPAARRPGTSPGRIITGLMVRAAAASRAAGLLSMVADTTISLATVCQGTFHSATTVLGFERVDPGCGGPVSVRSAHSRVISPRADEASHF